MAGESSTVADLIASGDIELIQDGNHGGNYPKSTEFVDSGIPLITGACLEDGRVNLSKASFLNPDRAESLRVGFAKTGDVLLSHKGTMGKTAIVPQIESPYIILNPQLTLYRINPNGRLKAEFLRYYFDSAFFQAHIVNISATSTINTLPVSEQKRLLIPVPEIQLQEQIISQAGSLDDKIELNRRINETLEGMAQALFKSWFVDFDPVVDNALAVGNPIPEPLAQRAETRRQALANGTANRESAQVFPASFRFTEELGWIPEGWEELKAESLVNRKKVNQKFTKKNVLDSGEVTVFDQGSGLILGYHDGQPDVESSVENPSFIFGDHTCITHLSTKPFSVGPNVIPLSALDHDPYWTYYAIKDVQTFQEYRRHWMEFKIKSVLVPPKSITSTFGNIVCNFYLAMESNSEESQTLAKLRDVLLPKLISGELRIPQAEKMVEEAMA